jgi:hypothetical protein
MTNKNKNKQHKKQRKKKLEKLGKRKKPVVG